MKRIIDKFCRHHPVVERWVPDDDQTVQMLRQQRHDANKETIRAQLKRASVTQLISPIESSMFPEEERR